MSTIATILKAKGAQVATLTADRTVLDGLKLMAERNIGAIMIVDGDELLGIFTERDYARKIILMDRASKETKLSEIMTGSIHFVSPNAKVDECLKLMTNKFIRHLPVLDEGKLVGVVSIGDLVKMKMDDQQAAIDNLQSYISGQ